MNRLAPSLLLALAVGGCVAAVPPAVVAVDHRQIGPLGNDPAANALAIDRAIAATHAAGGGTVVIPAGRFASYTIHLKSNVELRLERGCVLVAAGGAGYELAEPNAFSPFQDYGHSHWHNSLIVGDGVDHVAITGPGEIDGTALSDGWTATATSGTQPTSQSSTQATSQPADPRDTLVRTPRDGSAPPRASTVKTSDALKPGVGNKAIALRNCRDVTLRDFSILRGGHFGILATGVDTLTIDNLKIDTNRDGMDVDACRNVRISNCTVNSPNDDGICLKSSFGLGELRSTDDVTITNCYVTGGYHIGTVLDGSWQRFRGDEKGGRTGRIKMGTESNGGFKRIAIANCVLDYCGGVFIESEDGAIVEDISVSNLVMHDVADSPIFIRLGARLRGPNTPAVGVIRRVSVSNVVATNVNWRFGTLISGIPGHPVEDVTLSDVIIRTQGGGTATEAALEPPEREAAYPDPQMFGTLPSYGLFARHVKNLTVQNAQITSAQPDARPWAALWDVDGATFAHVRGSPAGELPVFNFRGVSNLHVSDSLQLADRDLPVVVDGNEIQPSKVP